VRNRLMGLIAAVATVPFLSAAIFGQTADQSKKIEAQGADITGVWLVQKFQPNMSPKEKPPLTPWGEAQLKAADTTVNDPNLACLPHGVPRIMYVPLPMEIMQIPGRVLVYQEAGNELRQIFLNREHPKDLDPTYNGNSVGKWERNTLVVDTIGFNDITWLDHVGLRHSDALHVVERIRRVDRDTLEDNFTIEDPKAFTKPWTSQQVYKLKPGWEIAEYTCENNKYVYHAPK
jgi:hypothetical protein